MNKLVRTSSFQELGASLHLPKTPNCVPDGTRSEGKDAHMLYQEYVTCVIKLAAITGYHPVGTARMGSKDDPKAVVDKKLR